MKYKIIKAADLLHDHVWRESVDGEPLTFPEYPTLRFFIRENKTYLKDYWEITEARTGMLIAEDFGKEKTIANAGERLAKTGIIRVNNVIKTQVEIFGESNPIQ